jgi:sec-independent protein translocase protein TatC
MPLHAHLREARTRLFAIFTVFVFFSSLAYYFRNELLAALLTPLHGEKLSYLNPGGGFGFVFAVTMWAGVALTAPAIIYSLYKFIAPALPVKAQSRGGVILLFSYLLFIAGATFGYLYAIPGALNFLVGFGDGFVQAMLTADAYLNFVLMYTVGLGLLFQIPILMIVIHWISPLGPLRLLRFERYVIVGAFVAAAIITPTPDIVNQLIVAAPFIAMYQVGLLGISVSHLRHRRAQRRKNDAAKLPTKEREGASAPISKDPSPTVIQQALAPAPGSGSRVRGVARPQRSKSVDGFSRPQSRPAPRAVGQVSIPARPSAPAQVPRPPQLRSGQSAMDVFLAENA